MKEESQTNGDDHRDSRERSMEAEENGDDDRRSGSESRD